MAENQNLKLESEDNNQKRENLSQRLNDFTEQETAYLKINGGSKILGNMEESLKLLAENIFPRQDNLPEMIRRAIESRDKQGRSLEEIWQEKIQQGADYIGVLDGTFHFFKGEEILDEDNVDLRVSALPRILRMREVERNRIIEDSKRELSSLKAELVSDQTPPQNDLNGEVEIVGGVDVV